MKSPGVWTIRTIDGIKCECYCGINWDTRISKYLYKIISFDPYKSIKVKNPKYDPTIKKPKKPLYCKKKPSDHCYKNNCPHFAYTEYTEDE